MKPITRITADIHKGHGGILKYCASTRHFARIEDHDDAVLAAWKDAGIQKDDITIVVGDLAHGRIEEKPLRKFFDALPGKKILIKGNHDGPATLALPWVSVHDRLNASIDNQRVVLDHYALRSWEGIRKGAIQLHGHHHGRLPGNSQQCDVGVDVFGFAPVRMAVIKHYLATLPPLVDPEGRDFSNDIEGMKP